MSTQSQRPKGFGKNPHNRIRAIIIFVLLFFTPEADAAYVAIENISPPTPASTYL